MREPMLKMKGGDFRLLDKLRELGMGSACAEDIDPLSQPAQVEQSQRLVAANAPAALEYAVADVAMAYGVEARVERGRNRIGLGEFTIFATGERSDLALFWSEINEILGRDRAQGPRVKSVIA